MGWAEGRWNHQGIDLNHNFADLNTPLWQAEDEGLVPDTVPNHHLPLPTYYTLPNATVSILGHPGGLCLCLPLRTGTENFLGVSFRISRRHSFYAF